MRLSHPDYIKLLMESYQKKRANNQISLLLAQSAPAKIRQACLHLYKEYIDKEEIPALRKDEQALRDFFGPAEHGKKFIQLIENFEADRFRPLDNYLKGHTERTDERNVELLAWLIDFKHRPYSFDKNFQLTDEELALLKDSIQETAIDEPTLPAAPAQSDRTDAPAKMETGPALETSFDEMEPGLTAAIADPGNNKKEKKRKGVLVLLVVMVVSGVLFYAHDRQSDTSFSLGSSKSICVYWAGDHYEEVPCNEPPGDRLIITMEQAKAKRFRRITREDTLSVWSVGKIYYIKDSNKIKYYTEAGNYPENINRNLKLLSNWIFEKYILKKYGNRNDTVGDKNEAISTR